MDNNLVDFVALRSELYDYSTTLKCPQCGCEYFHPVSISVHRMNDITTVANDGIMIRQEENQTRGVTITLQYNCEQGHHGEIIFQFHEGNTEVHHKPLPNKPKFQAIWRD